MLLTAWHCEYRYGYFPPLVCLGTVSARVCLNALFREPAQSCAFLGRGVGNSDENALLTVRPRRVPIRTLPAGTVCLPSLIASA
jgi:hypothetical protein